MPGNHFVSNPLQFWLTPKIVINLPTPPEDIKICVHIGSQDL